MNKISYLSCAVIGLFIAPLYAGDLGPSKNVVTPPTCDYGTGWYATLYGGGNVYQSFKNNYEHDFANGDVVSLHIDHNLGGYGGLGFGYVFGNGKVRFALEEDLFYNGVGTSSQVYFNGNQIAHSSNLVNSGAFMTNFILRFPLGDGKFQPYFGAGPGAYYAETAGADVTLNRGNRTFSTGGGANSGSFAFDVVAGADYYFTCKMSVFAEYHFLDYVALDVGTGHHELGQQLVGGGIRFHF